jgi:hypothetical protein
VPRPAAGALARGRTGQLWITPELGPGPGREQPRDLPISSSSEREPGADLAHRQPLQRRHEPDHHSADLHAITSSRVPDMQSGVRRHSPASGMCAVTALVIAARVGGVEGRSAGSFSRVLFRTIQLAVAGGVHIGRADGLARRALRLHERVGYPVAESQQAGSDQCCRQGAAPPDRVG